MEVAGRTTGFGDMDITGARRWMEQLPPPTRPTESYRGAGIGPGQDVEVKFRFHTAAGPGSP